MTSIYYKHYWEVPGRPRTNWKDSRDRRTQKEAEAAALDRQQWHQSTAKYVRIDAG